MTEPEALTRAAERIEADAVASMTLAAPAAVAAGLQLHVVADEGVVSVLAAAVDVLQFNRVVALGVDRPATEAQLDRLIVAARDRGVRRLIVHAAPNAAPTELTTWLHDRGARLHNRWVRHWRRTDGPPDAPTALRIAPIDAGTAVAFGVVITSSFGMPPALVPWLAALATRPGWHVLGAFDGDALVAGATFYAQPPYAWLGLGSTLAEHRGRGAQSALIAARLAAAARLGCEWAIVETAEETADRPVASYRNMRRLGFEEPYRRPNYLVALGE